VINRKLMEQGTTLLLRGMGVDLNDEHFKDTPARVAKMYEEMLTPHTNSMTTFETKHNNMIVLRGHRTFLLCPHHLQVAEVRASVAYISKRKILGLSKLARAVDQYLTKPITQEELCNAIADGLDRELDPQGVAVVLVGAHNCMRARGVRTEADVVTSSLRGLFLHSAAAREEFFQVIGRP
jgi:GTP cyclohydrolase I